MACKGWAEARGVSLQPHSGDLAGQGVYKENSRKKRVRWAGINFDSYQHTTKCCHLVSAYPVPGNSLNA